MNVTKKNLNQKIGGRTVQSSIAKDNGRATEFIRRKDYPDKSFCYECREEGHLSYQCEKNTLGERIPPPKKIRKRKAKDKGGEGDTSYYDSDSEDGVREVQQSTSRYTDSDDCAEDQESLSAVIKEEARKEVRFILFQVLFNKNLFSLLNEFFFL